MDLNFSKNIGLSATRQINPTRNLLIEVILLVIVCGLFTWFIILPKRADVNLKKETLNRFKEQAVNTQKQEATLRGLITELNVSKDDVEKLDKAIPLEQNMPQLESLLTDIARSVNVSLGNFGLSGRPNSVAAGNKELLANPYKPARTLQKISGSLVVGGTFSQLKAFIEKLEGSGRLINITDMQMDAGTNGSLNLRLNVNVYFFGV
jgi:Tfp pilus assembly protein PilO